MKISIPANEERFNKYLSELAVKQKYWKYKRNDVEQNTFEFFSKNHSFNYTSFKDFINWDTGAVYICDEDLINLRRFRPLHPIFSVFDADIGQSKRRYTLNLNDGVILRGTDNYYFGVAYWHQNKSNTSRYVDTVLGQVSSFINKCLLYIKENSLDVDDKYDFLFLYAFGDVCFNFLIQKLYTNFKAKTNKTDCIVKNCNMRSIEKKLISIAAVFVEQQYSLVFSPNNYSLNILKLYTNEMLQLIKIYRIEVEYIPKSLLRFWRETDNFIENTMIFYSLKSEFSFNDNVMFWGINYGSFHLAIQASTLFRSLLRCKTEVGFIFTRRTYHMIYKDQELFDYKFCSDKSKTINIVVDDNIVSGKSLEEAIMVLRDKGYIPYKAIIMHHPSINRIYQMYYSPNRACVNLEIIDSFLLGMFYPTHFTKIINKEYACKYLDKLGVFDSAKQFVFERIYCNELYGDDSIIKYTFESS